MSKTNLENEVRDWLFKRNENHARRLDDHDLKISYMAAGLIQTRRHVRILWFLVLVLTFNELLPLFQ
jgi:hypothetical protein